MENVVSYLPSMQLARCSFGCVKAGGEIYAIGGHVGMTHDWKAANFTATCEAFDLSKRSWRWTAPRPAAAEGFSIAATDRYVYAFGGMVHDPDYAPDQDAYASIAQIDRYDIPNDRWDTIGALPGPRSLYAMARIGSVLYFLGGWNLNGKAGASSPPLQEVDVFDLDTESASRSRFVFGEEFAPRVGADSLSYRGTALVFGGVHHPDMYKLITVFDPSGPTPWRTAPEALPIGLMDLRLHYNSELDRVWAFGGYSSGENNSDQVFSARVQDLLSEGSKNPWRVEAPMPQALTFFGLVKITPGVVGLLGGSCNPATGGPQTAEFALYPLKEQLHA